MNIMMDEEEWFYNSLSRYNELHMFDLHKQAVEMDLTSTNNLCVALEEDSNQRTEVLIFHLPSTLEKKTDTKSVKLDRHLLFHQGYFTDSPVVQMKCTSPEDNLIISERNGAALYDIASKESDIIQKVSDIPGDVKSAFIALHPSKQYVVLCDGKTGNRSIVDYKMMTNVSGFENVSSEPAVPMFSSTDVVSFGNVDSGCVTSYDIRNGKETSSIVASDFIQPPKRRLKRWIFNSTFECIKEPNAESFLYACCDGDDLMLFDWRNVSKPIQLAKFSICCKRDDDYRRRINVCPLNVNQFTLTGFDENVYICELENNEANYIFIHEGHSYCQERYEPNVRTNCSLWLPSISPNTIVSSASNASVQCWQYQIFDTPLEEPNS